MRRKWLLEEEDAVQEKDMRRDMRVQYSMDS
jgi:hypothetical protein